LRPAPLTLAGRDAGIVAAHSAFFLMLPDKESPPA
jgi:hypothetical protein